MKGCLFKRNKVLKKCWSSRKQGRKREVTANFGLKTTQNPDQMDPTGDLYCSILSKIDDKLRKKYVKYKKSRINILLTIAKMFL